MKLKFQFSNNIKRIHSDKGTEYYFNLFNEFYKQHGIVHEKTAPYPPKIKDKVERKNIVLNELVVVITLSFGVASHKWGNFLLIVYYVLNRVPKSKNNISTYEILNKIHPNLYYFRTWDFPNYVSISDQKQVKLVSKAYEWVFIGYAENSKAYRCYDLNAKLVKVSNYVEF